MYSDIVKVIFIEGERHIVVNANPVTNGIIVLQLINEPQGIYRFRLINKIGQVVHLQSYYCEGVASATIIINAYNLVTGIYQLETIAADKTASYNNISIQVK